MSLFSGAMLVFAPGLGIICRGDICSCGFLSPRPMRQGYLGQIHGFIQEELHTQSMPPRNQEIVGLYIPRCSMYGVFTYIWVVLGVNVGKYTIH